MIYDVCALTGDYRSATFGRFDAALEGMARVRSLLRNPVYGVLGNHDTILMVPELEEMGIRMLLNECEKICAGIKRSIWPVSTTRTIIDSTISKRLRPKFLTTDSHSFCHTRQKSTARLHMLVSICF